MTIEQIHDTSLARKLKKIDGLVVVQRNPFLTELAIADSFLSLMILQEATYEGEQKVVTYYCYLDGLNGKEIIKRNVLDVVKMAEMFAKLAAFTNAEHKTIQKLFQR